MVYSAAMIEVKGADDPWTWRWAQLMRVVYSIPDPEAAPPSVETMRLVIRALEDTDEEWRDAP